MAPVVCVAVSQRLGRSVTDNGSPAETYQDRMNSRGDSRSRDRTLEIGCRIDLHFVLIQSPGRGSTITCLRWRSANSSPMSVHIGNRQKRLSRLTAIRAVCVIDAAS